MENMSSIYFLFFKLLFIYISIIYLNSRHVKWEQFMKQTEWGHWPRKIPVVLQTAAPLNSK